MQDPVEAVLLAFLANNRGDSANETIISVLSEDLVDVLEHAENDIGEGCGECDGFLEVVDGEVVLATTKSIKAIGRESTVGIKGVKLFLSLSYRELIDDLVLLESVKIFLFETPSIVSDVVEELTEESDLKDFVEGNQAEIDYAFVANGTGSAAIWKSAMGLLLDIGDGCRTGVGEAIAKRELELRAVVGAGSKGSASNKRGNAGEADESDRSH